MRLREQTAFSTLVKQAQPPMAEVGDHRARRARLIGRDRLKIWVREPLDPQV